MSATSPGDVKIYSAMLGGSFATVDVSRRIMDMSVFHDLKKPYSSVVLNLQDSSGLLQNMKLDGTQTFATSFGQPPDQDPYEGEWVLTNIENVTGTNNQRTEFFRATGFSKHMLNLQKVQRSFRDVPMTDAIRTLVNEVLSPSKPFNVLAPSRNITGDKRMPYTINGQQVFKAIRQLMHGSASSKDTSSAYVLFERHKELVLDTLENIAGNVGGGPTYYQQVLGSDFLIDVARQQFTILALRENSRADAAVQAQDKAQSTNVVDIFNTVFKNTPFGSGKASSYASLAYNSMRVPSFMQDAMAPRRRVAGQFDQQSFTLTVPLNPALDVGKGFSVSMSAALGETDDSVEDRVSGDLVATQVRHTVNMQTPRSTSMLPGTTSVTGVKGNRGYND